MAESYPKKITLGSGKLYIKEFTDEMPEVDTMCVDENILGLISGGATLTYTPTFYEAKDDLGLVKKSAITEEEVTLKSGVMTFNGETLAKLSATARVTTDATKHRRIVKVGGAGNDNGKSYALCFKHDDKTDGACWVQIVGRNQSGFELAFVKDKETVVDVEFKALPCDDEGTQVIYTEEDASINA